MHVKSITIENLRCFQTAGLELQYPGREKEAGREDVVLPNINLLLGNNGAGKTSVLRALALAALSPVMPQSGFRPYRLVRRTGKAKGERTDEKEIKESNISAEVLLHDQDLKPDKLGTPRLQHMSVKLVIRSGNNDSLVSGNGSPSGEDLGIWEIMYDDKSPAFLVVGYSANRRVEEAKSVDIGAQQKERLLRYQRVASLFEPRVALVPLSFWLPSCEKERSKQVVTLVDQLLPEEASFTGEYKDGEYFFEVNGVPTPFDALSDGYRAYIGWVADLLYHIQMGASAGAKLAATAGLVMVDEIDLHLHPEWQRSVTSSLSAALPNLQFVFTTHSPIVAGSLNKENIFVLASEPSGGSTVRQYHRERIYGLDAEQILLSSYFNLKTTRAETFTSELRELAGKAGRGDKEAALDYAKKLAAATPPSPESPQQVLDDGHAARRKRLVFVGRFDRVLRVRTQVILLTVAALLLSAWAVVGLLPDRYFGGYVHVLLGGALAILAEIAALIVALISSRRSAVSPPKPPVPSAPDEAEESAPPVASGQG